MFFFVDVGFLMYCDKILIDSGGLGGEEGCFGLGRKVWYSEDVCVIFMRFVLVKMDVI